MSYNLYFQERKSRVVSDDPYAWGIPTLVKARKFAIGSLGSSRRVMVAIYYKDGTGMEIYKGSIKYEGDGYFYYPYSGKKWRMNEDGTIRKLKKAKKPAPFGL